MPWTQHTHKGWKESWVSVLTSSSFEMGLVAAAYPRLAGSGASGASPSPPRRTGVTHTWTAKLDFCCLWEGKITLTWQVIYSWSHLPIVLLLISLPTVRFPYGFFFFNVPLVLIEPSTPVLPLTMVLRQFHF